MKKQFITVFLGICLILLLLPNIILAAGNKADFDDVKTTDWFSNAVDFVVERGLMNGTSDKYFSPSDTTTRGMVVTVLYRMENEPEITGNPFNDVADGQYYSRAVAWANYHGIVKGYEDTIFAPDDAITREQLAAVFYRYAQYKGYSVSIGGNLDKFSDAAKVSFYAKEAMGWAVGSGLISGVENNMLDPQGNAERAQVATILMRFYEIFVDTSDKADNNYSNDNDNSSNGTSSSSSSSGGGSGSQGDTSSSSGGGNNSGGGNSSGSDDNSGSDDSSGGDDNSGSQDGTEPEQGNLVITITNSEYKGEDETIITQEHSFVLTGTITGTGEAAGISVVYNNYYVSDEQANVDGLNEWSVEIPLELGFNAINIKVSDKTGNIYEQVVKINRVNDVIHYKETVKIAADWDYETLYDEIVGCWSDDNGTEDINDDIVVLLVQDNSLLMRQIEAGLLELGDVYMIPKNDWFLIGFTGVYKGHRAPQGNEYYPAEVYSDAGYEEILFTYPSFADIFDDDISLDFSAGVDPDNPINFAIFPDGTEMEFDIETEPDVSEAVMYMARIGLNRGWNPRELLKVIKPTLYLGYDSKLNIGLKFGGVVVYDEDGDSNTKGDQIKLSGELSIQDIVPDGCFEWHELPFLSTPEQIMLRMNFDVVSNLKVEIGNINDSVGTTIDTSSLVARLNKLPSLSTDSEILGAKLSGVSSLSSKWILGYISLNLTPPSATVGSLISDPGAVIDRVPDLRRFVPSVIFMLYIDIDGHITAIGSLGFDYKTNIDIGFNLQENSYVGKYGSVEDSRGSTHYDMSDHSLDLYNYTLGSSPEAYIEAYLEAELNCGMGAGAALEIAGCIPLMLDTEIYVHNRGELDGSMRFILQPHNNPPYEVKFSGKALLEFAVKWKTEIAFRLFIETALGNVDLSRNWVSDIALFEEKWEISAPAEELEGIGNISGLVKDAEDKQSLQGAVIKLREGLDNQSGEYLQINNQVVESLTDSYGSYFIDGLDTGEYTMEVSIAGYVTQYANISLSKYNHFGQMDFQLKHLPGISVVVKNEVGTLLDGVAVNIEDTANGYTYESETENGRTFIELDAGEYRVTFTLDNYDTVTETVVISDKQETVECTLHFTEPEETFASGMITDSETGEPLSDVTLKLRAGASVNTGDYVQVDGQDWEMITLNDGLYSVTGLPAGDYTLEAQKDGYDTKYRNIVVGKTLASTEQNLALQESVKPQPWFGDIHEMGYDFEQWNPIKAGTSIKLLNSAGNEIESTTTEADGSFSFTGIYDNAKYLEFRYMFGSALTMPTYRIELPDSCAYEYGLTIAARSKNVPGLQTGDSNPVVIETPFLVVIYSTSNIKYSWLEDSIAYMSDMEQEEETFVIMEEYEPETVLPEDENFEPETVLPEDENFEPETVLPEDESFEPETVLPEDESFEPETVLSEDENFEPEMVLPEDENFEPETVLLEEENFGQDNEYAQEPLVDFEAA